MKDLTGCCKFLSNMKLNKILYYAQGHCLQQTGHVMFSDPIEAWEHGPVVSSVYHKYKSYSDNPITDYDVDIIGEVMDDYREILLEVARMYSRYTSVALRNMTHVPKGPWAKVYATNVPHVEIPVSSIKEFFDSKVDKIKPIDLNLTEEDFVGYKDSDGILVLPKEWNDEEVEDLYKLVEANPDSESVRGELSEMLNYSEDKNQRDNYYNQDIIREVINDLYMSI